MKWLAQGHITRMHWTKDSNLPCLFCSKEKPDPLNSDSSNQSSRVKSLCKVVCIGSFLSSLIFSLAQTFITSYFNSWNSSSTGFCISNISILKSQIKPLWSCPFLSQKPPMVPHCLEVGFPAGGSQTFARWIIKPHYHILCRPLHCCWLTHLKCTGTAAMPVTYLHFKCPRLKRIWMIRSEEGHDFSMSLFTAMSHSFGGVG